MKKPNTRKSPKRTPLKMAALAMALALLLALAASCSSGAATPPASATTPANSGENAATPDAGAGTADEPDIITLRTSTKKNCTSTPWVVGEAKGIFEKHGIAIEYTGELGSGESLPALLNGTNDIEGGFPNALATYLVEGAPIKAVTMNQVDPPAGSDVDPKYRHMRFYVAADSEIKTLDDLKNYTGDITISGRAPSCSSFIPTQIFKNNGLDPTLLQFVAFDSDTASIQAVQQGNLLIAGIHPPFYYLAEQEGLTLLADSADSGLGAAAGVTLWFFTEEFIENNPVAVQRFVDAIEEAQAYVLDHEEEAIALTAEYIEKEINAVHYYYTGEGFPDDLIQPWIDDLVDAGALEPGQLTVEDLYTSQFQS